MLKSIPTGLQQLNALKSDALLDEFPALTKSAPISFVASPIRKIRTSSPVIKCSSNGVYDKEISSPSGSVKKKRTKKSQKKSLALIANSSRMLFAADYPSVAIDINVQRLDCNSVASIWHEHDVSTKLEFSSVRPTSSTTALLPSIRVDDEGFVDSLVESGSSGLVIDTLSPITSDYRCDLTVHKLRPSSNEDSCLSLWPADATLSDSTRVGLGRRDSISECNSIVFGSPELPRLWDSLRPDGKFAHTNTRGEETFSYSNHLTDARAPVQMIGETMDQAVVAAEELEDGTDLLHLISHSLDRFNAIVHPNELSNTTSGIGTIGSQASSDPDSSECGSWEQQRAAPREEHGSAVEDEEREFNRSFPWSSDQFPASCPNRLPIPAELSCSGQRVQVTRDSRPAGSSSVSFPVSCPSTESHHTLITKTTLDLESRSNNVSSTLGFSGSLAVFSNQLAPATTAAAVSPVKAKQAVTNSVLGACRFTPNEVRSAPSNSSALFRLTQSLMQVDGIGYAQSPGQISGLRSASNDLLLTGSPLTRTVSINTHSSSAHNWNAASASLDQHQDSAVNPGPCNLDAILGGLSYLGLNVPNPHHKWIGDLNELASGDSQLSSTVEPRTQHHMVSSVSGVPPPPGLTALARADRDGLVTPRSSDSLDLFSDGRRIVEQQLFPPSGSLSQQQQSRNSTTGACSRRSVLSACFPSAKVWNPSELDAPLIAAMDSSSIGSLDATKNVNSVTHGFFSSPSKELNVAVVSMVPTYSSSSGIAIAGREGQHLGRRANQLNSNMNAIGNVLFSSQPVPDNVRSVSNSTGQSLTNTSSQASYLLSNSVIPSFAFPPATTCAFTHGSPSPSPFTSVIKPTLRKPGAHQYEIPRGDNNVKRTQLNKVNNQYERGHLDLGLFCQARQLSCGGGFKGPRSTSTVSPHCGHRIPSAGSSNSSDGKSTGPPGLVEQLQDGLGSKPAVAKWRRACSFYLRGHCKKEDCEFAHDLTKVTCKFWEMGECFKGSTCPFLHGYPPELNSSDKCGTKNHAGQ
ncbi:hypothetical protein PHET_06745 [Paragonimus heterotremus]|uniref:C3H1-type domain-containing protein n=1 Tax=Paragonimus heterotremus TaxID=100268 RepID=A0A8J4WYC7_9TREM|nr:hypothetical protein PHET_06745 [Paragonimus heterotremus]